MLLSANLLNDVVDVNHFSVADQLEAMEGDTVQVYFQLVDRSVSWDCSPPGRRYIPQVGATVVVVLRSIDSGLTLTKTCTQPYVNDLSIWTFSIAATESLPGTRSLKLTLTEGLVVTNGLVEQAIVVAPLSGEF
jgi:hypothetical protein